MHMAGQAGTLSTGHASSAIHMGPMTFTEGSWAAAAVTDTNKLFALHLPVHRLAQRGVAMRFSDAHGHHGMVDEQQGLPDTVLGMGHAAQGQHYVSATGA